MKYEWNCLENPLQLKCQRNRYFNIHTSPRIVDVLCFESLFRRHTDEHRLAHRHRFAIGRFRGHSVADNVIEDTIKYGLTNVLADR
jgi:hypothetical protein